MPFTLSHAAAAIPFRRTRLIMSALVFGCFAPDMEYFLWLRPHGHFGHTLPGLFIFDLPASLVALFLFHRYAREPLLACLPLHLRERVRRDRGPSMRSVSGFLLVCVSILVGIATHFLWDSFTHADYWLGQHLEFLKIAVDVPLFGSRPLYAVLQYLSSVLGIIAIRVWFILWYRRTPPVHSTVNESASARDRIVVSAAIVVAVIAGLVRAAISGIPNGVHGSQRFMTDASITGITVFCFELLAYGFLHNRLRHPSEPV